MFSTRSPHRHASQKSITDKYGVPYGIFNSRRLVSPHLERDRFRWNLHFRRPRESGDPGASDVRLPWVPAFAGTTKQRIGLKRSRSGTKRPPIFFVLFVVKALLLL